MITCLTCSKAFEPLCFGDPDCLACNRAERIKVLEAQVLRLQEDLCEVREEADSLEASKAKQLSNA